jgi:transcriptional regulator with XRE-family HTH domain
MTAKTNKAGPRDDDADGASETADKSGSLGTWANLLVEAARAKGMTKDDLCKFLDISPSYLSLLERGGSGTQKTIGRPILEKSAQILDLSVFNTYMLAGILRPADCFLTFEREVMANQTFELMKKDTQWAAYLMSPAEWASLSVDSKLGVILLYQCATRTVLMDLISQGEEPEEEAPTPARKTAARKRN